MKKLLVVFLSAVLLLSLSVTVWAGSSEGDLRTEEIPVTASYEATTEAAVVYSVDIIWGDMAFTYKASNPGTWNPDTLTYEGSTEPGWTFSTATSSENINGNQIRVTNRSNADIFCNFSFAPTSDGTYSNISGSFSPGSFFRINPAQIGSASSEIVSLNLDGTPPSDIYNTRIGTITISIESY